MAAAGAVGAQKFPIKVQGKEYKLDHVGIDTLVAKSGVSGQSFLSSIHSTRDALTRSSFVLLFTG